MEGGRIYKTGQVVESEFELDKMFREKFQLITAASIEEDKRKAELEAIVAQQEADRLAAQLQAQMDARQGNDDAIIGTDLDVKKPIDDSKKGNKPPVDDFA